MSNITRIADGKKVAVVCNTIIIITAIIANTFGLCWIIKFRKLCSNQTKIIFSISLADVIISSFTLSMIVHGLTASSGFYDSLNLYLWLTRSALYISWFLMFYLLMLDRFLGSCFPFWYKSNSSPDFIRNSLVALWLTPCLLAPILCAITPKHQRDVFNKFVWMVFDVAFLSLFTVLYTAIFFIKRQSNARAGRRTQAVKSTRFFRVTSAMLIAFLLLETFPSAGTSILYLMDAERADSYSLYCELIWSLNMLADPIIYIFMQPNALKDLRAFFGGYCRVNQGVATKASPSIFDNRRRKVESNV